MIVPIINHSKQGDSAIVMILSDRPTSRDVIIGQLKHNGEASSVLAKLRAIRERNRH